MHAGSWPCWRPSFGHTRQGQEVHGLPYYRNITSSKAPGLTFGPEPAWHHYILCVHTFCSLEEFTITALVESQHTSSSYTIDNSPSYSAFRLRKPLGRRACRILQLSDNEKSVKFKFAKDEMQIPDLFCGPSWQGLGLWSFTSSSSSEQVRDRFHVQQRHNRYLGEHQWGKNISLWQYQYL